MEKVLYHENENMVSAPWCMAYVGVFKGTKLVWIILQDYRELCQADLVRLYLYCLIYAEPGWHCPLSGNQPVLRKSFWGDPGMTLTVS